MPLEFDWDDANISHIARHDVLPHETEEVVRNKPLELGASVDRGELRLTMVGVTDAGRMLALFVTPRGWKWRVVTCYPAGARLRRTYLTWKESMADEGL